MPTANAEGGVRGKTLDDMHHEVCFELHGTLGIRCRHAPRYLRKAIRTPVSSSISGPWVDAGVFDVRTMLDGRRYRRVYAHVYRLEDSYTDMR